MQATDKLKKKSKRKQREDTVAEKASTVLEIEDGEVEEESALDSAAPKEASEHGSDDSEVDEAMATGNSSEQPALKKSNRGPTVGLPSGESVNQPSDRLSDSPTMGGLFSEPRWGLERQQTLETLTQVLAEEKRLNDENLARKMELRERTNIDHLLSVWDPHCGPSPEIPFPLERARHWMSEDSSPPPPKHSAQHIRLLQTQNLKTLTSTSKESLLSFITHVKSLDAGRFDYKLGNMIEEQVKRTLISLLKAAGVPEAERLPTWTIHLFESKLRLVFPETFAGRGVTELSLEEFTKSVKLDVSSNSTLSKYQIELRQGLAHKSDNIFKNQSEEALVGFLLKSWEPYKKDSDVVTKLHDAMKKYKTNIALLPPGYDVLDRFLFAMTEHMNKVFELIREGKELGLHLTSQKSEVTRSASSSVSSSNFGKDRKATKFEPNKPFVPKAKPSAPVPPAKNLVSSTIKCTGCGKVGHSADDCTQKDTNKDWNPNPNVQWKDTEAAKKYPNPPDGREKTLPFPKSPYAKKPKHGKSLVANLYEHEDAGLIPISIITPTSTIDTNVLLDTGAFQGNYGSLELQAQLHEAGYNTSPCGSEVCSVIGNKQKCSRCSTIMESVKVNLKSKSFNKTFTIDIKFTELDYDLIIGRPTIIQHRLLQVLEDTMIDAPSEKETIADVGRSDSSKELTYLGTWPETQWSRDPVCGITSLDLGYARAVPKLASLVDKKFLLHYDDDEKEDVLEEADWFITEGYDKTKIIHEDDILSMVTLEGPNELQTSLRHLLSEFRDVFQTALGKTPADLPAMELTVDESKWSSNKTLPRPQTLQKQREIRRQVDLMLDAGIIVKSQATSYSQVLLTPKPNDAWRFCIDYRRLNDASVSLGWPIPNIQAMLQRLGSSRSKYFGVMDLTSGYHQLMMGLQSRKLTAFVTLNGVYEFTRVPFGLKGAPAFFQQTMVTRVLNGLVHNICEVYVDDIIVYAQTEEEFVDNTRRVLQRMRQHGLVIHPKKTRLGLNVIEYVGHTISDVGMSFTKAKTEAVFQTEKPKTQKHLRSFLGLANYFRDHIRDYSLIVRPLQALIRNYKKYSVIHWSPQADDAFEQIKDRINNCPTLYFLDEQAPIFLHTDASDYGIGAYLFQQKENKDYPIAFMSKCLEDSQRENWSVYEKEAFAIFVALGKFEHLIRDTHFTLRTDHRNLTFLDKATSSRVRRWKLAMQEYDFDVEHIAGTSNFVADALSRDLPHSIKESLAADELRVPDREYKLINAVHNRIAGHHGVERTLAKLSSQGQTWTGMRLHVKHYIRKCAACQKMSEIKPAIHTLRTTLAKYEPMERLNVDSIGPLTPDEKGNEHILVIIDCFTRFVELYPIPNTTAAVTARMLLQHIGRYGAPCEILSDNGSQFVNNTIGELLKIIGTDQVLTIAYSHEENGIVERANKEVMRHLRDIVFETNTIHNWSEMLPLVQRIMNASVHGSTGVSPAHLLFGKAITLDRGIFLPTSTDHEEIHLSTWIQDMLSTQSKLMNLARETQQARDDSHTHPRDDDEQLHKRSKRHRKGKEISPITEFAPDSYVLVSYPESRQGSRPPNKLSTNLKGPMKVIRHDGAAYEVMNMSTMKTTVVHVTRLRPYHYDADRVNPTTVANADDKLYEVEEILAHRGNPRGKVSNLEFLVRWHGYDSTGDSWESWGSLRTNQALHKYLKDNGMSALIPKQFR
jgi:hypothetical protein